MPMMHKFRGFTLIEILVVVVIVAIIVGTVVLSTDLVGDDRELEKERDRLASLIEVVQDEALMQGREFGLELMQSSYRFVEFDPLSFQWNEVLGDDLLRLRHLPEGMELDLYVEDKLIVLATDPAQFEDPDDEKKAASDDYEPHIFVFSSGESTPYEIRLRRDFTDRELVMRGDIFGEIEFVEDLRRGVETGQIVAALADEPNQARAFGKRITRPGVVIRYLPLADVDRLRRPHQRRKRIDAQRGGNKSQSGSGHRLAPTVRPAGHWPAPGHGDRSLARTPFATKG